MASLQQELGRYYTQTKRGRKTLRRARSYNKAGNTSGGGAYGVQAAMAQRGITPGGNRRRQYEARDLRRLQAAGFGQQQQQSTPTQPMYPQYTGPQYSLEDYMGEANNYMQSYRENINKSRLQIEQQFQLAFADAGKREMISQGVVQGLAPELDAIYGGASAQIDKEGAESLAIQESHNLGSFESSGAGGEGAKAGMTAAFASRKADIPMLAAGVTSQINRQKGALGQAKFDRQGDLDRAAAEMEIQFTKEQGNARRDYMMAQQQRQWSIEDRNFGAAQDARMAAENREPDNFERDRAAAREDSIWAMEQEQDAQQGQERALAWEKLRGFSGADGGTKRAQALRAARPKEYDRISNSYNMKEAEGWLKRGQRFGPFGQWNQKPSVEDVAKELERHGKYRLAGVFRFRNS